MVCTRYGESLLRCNYEWYFPRACDCPTLEVYGRSSIVIYLNEGWDWCVISYRYVFLIKYWDFKIPPPRFRFLISGRIKISWILFWWLEWRMMHWFMWPVHQTKSALFSFHLSTQVPSNLFSLFIRQQAVFSPNALSLNKGLVSAFKQVEDTGRY